MPAGADSEEGPVPDRRALLAALRRLAARSGAEDTFLVVLDLGGASRGSLVRALRLAHAEAIAHAAARRLRAAMAGGPLPYRIAPICHALLVEGPPGRALAIARAAMAAFGTPLAFLGARLPMVAAAGVLRFVPGEMAPSDLLRQAVVAALDARAAEGRVLVREAGTEAGAGRGLALIEALPRALRADGSLSLVYQPRIHLRDGRCARAEALLRWRHPSLGPVGPAEFVPLAEGMGLAAEMTAWVLRTALAQVAAWRDAGLGLGVSVNITAPDLEEEGFAASLAEGLRHHGLGPGAIELELTESLRRGGSRAARTAAALAAMGVALAIDDFGTAYSNLSDLRDMPAQVLKIDRSFVRDLESNARDRVLVEAMLGLARRLGYRTVAEGIETEGALRLLTAMGCDEGQGYHVARPMPAAELSAWVAAGRG